MIVILAAETNKQTGIHKLTDELFNNAVAAEYLSELMPDRTAEKWAQWLQNNRNKTRPATYRIPVEKLGGGVFYLREELAKFAEFEKSRTLGAIKLSGRAAEALHAIGFNEQGGSSTGRSFDVTAVTPQFSEGRKYIRIQAENPLRIYRIELDNARFLMNELAGIFNKCSEFKESGK